MNGIVIINFQDKGKLDNDLRKIVRMFKDKGVELDVVCADRYPITNIDFAINLTNKVNITRILELSGIYVFNNSDVSELVNNRLLFYKLVDKKELNRPNLVNDDMPHNILDITTGDFVTARYYSYKDNVVNQEIIDRTLKEFIVVDNNLMEGDFRDLNSELRLLNGLDISLAKITFYSSPNGLVIFNSIEFPFEVKYIEKYLDLIIASIRYKIKKKGSRF